MHSIISIGLSLAERFTCTVKKRASTIFKRPSSPSKQASVYSNAISSLPAELVFRDASSFELPLPSSVHSMLDLTGEELLLRNEMFAKRLRNAHDTSSTQTQSTPIKAIVPLTRSSTLVSDENVSFLDLDSIPECSDDASSGDYNDYSDYSFFVDDSSDEENEEYHPILRVHKYEEREVVVFTAPTTFYNLGFWKK